MGRLTGKGWSPWHEPTPELREKHKSRVREVNDTRRLQRADDARTRASSIKSQDGCYLAGYFLGRGNVQPHRGDFLHRITDASRGTERLTGILTALDYVDPNWCARKDGSAGLFLSLQSRFWIELFLDTEDDFSKKKHIKLEEIARVRGERAFLEGFFDSTLQVVFYATKTPVGTLKYFRSVRIRSRNTDLLSQIEGLLRGLNIKTQFAISNVNRVKAMPQVKILEDSYPTLLKVLNLRPELKATLEKVNEHCQRMKVKRSPSHPNTNLSAPSLATAQDPLLRLR